MAPKMGVGAVRRPVAPKPAQPKGFYVSQLDALGKTRFADGQNNAGKGGRPIKAVQPPRSRSPRAV